MIATDAQIVLEGSRIAQEGLTPTVGRIARRLGMSPAGAAWRLRRLRREGRWPFEDDVRAGHPFWGNGYAEVNP